MTPTPPSIDARAEVETQRTRRRVIIIGGLVPAVAAAVTAMITASWVPELPDPTAIHWSGGGHPDGFGSAWLSVLIPIIGVGIAAVLAVTSAWRPGGSGRLSSNQKLTVAASPFLAGVLIVASVGTLAGQRGLADARQAGGVGLLLLVAFAVGLIAAAAAWFLLPPADNYSIPGETPDPITASPSERMAWSRTTRIAPLVLALLAAICLLLFGTVIATLAAGTPGAAVVVAVLVLVVLLAIASSFWRVSADRRGLLIRSALGWPRVAVPASDIRSVSVLTVSPMADFGGWGWRWAGGRTGIIMRAGQAIEVTRHSGKRLVVTVDDAATGAGVLAAVVAERAGGAAHTP